MDLAQVELGFAFYASLLLTMAVVIGTGMYAVRMVKSAIDFSVGGHKSGPVMVAGVLVGTLVGGAATIGTAQLAFCIGLSAWWFTLGAGIGLLVMAAFYAVPLRRSALETVPQFLVLNFGPRAGVITSIASSIGIFFSIVASFLSAVNLLAVVFGLSVPVSILLTGLVTVAAVYGGGINGAGSVGVVKIIILYSTLIVGGVIAYATLGGYEQIRAVFPAMPWFSLFSKGWWPTIGDMLAMIVGILSTQTYIQAVFSARDAKVAVTGCVAGALLTIPVGIPVILIGMFMHEQDPSLLPINALPVFMMRYMPPWLGGAAIMGLLISAISSASGLALGVGTMLSRDIIGKYVNINDSAKLLRINRLCVLAVTVIAAVVTYINMRTMVLNLNFYSMAFRASAIIVPLSLAIFMPRRLPATGAVYSMAGGISAALVTPFIFPGGTSPILPGLAVSAVIAAGFIYRKEYR